MTRTHWYLTTTAAIALTAGVYASALAQSGSTYDPWRNPDSSSTRTTSTNRVSYDRYDKDVDSLVRDMEEIIRIGRRDRAADPRFLDDLENRLDNYKRAATGNASNNNSNTNTSSTPRYDDVIFADSFSAGNQSSSPNWQVIQTGWYIDRNEGLRSDVTEGRLPPSARDDRNPINDLFMSKKKRKKLKRKREEARRRAQPLKADISELVLEEKIPNNFTMYLSFKDVAGRGRLAAFLYQKGKRKIGYKLIMRDDGVSTAITLYRIGSRSNTLIAERAIASSRSRGQPRLHEIRWERGDSRRIGVTMDGNELFTVTDKSFGDDWDGFSLSNTHGDFIVRNIKTENNS